ncbi:MAG: hypothetical protein QM767_00085 [Anaeromyxobacter sp.]
MAVKVMVAPAIVKGQLAKAAATPVKTAETKDAPRPKRRRSSVYDADGNEVFITLMCLKCHKMRPLSQFGLRKMADGAIRNQPWCRTCRSAPSEKKGRKEEAPAVEESSISADSPEQVPSLTAEAPKRNGSVAAEVAAALAAGRG